MAILDFGTWVPSHIYRGRGRLPDHEACLEHFSHLFRFDT